MKEQGLGQAIQSNKAMFSNSLNNLGGDLIGYGLTKGLMGKVAAGDAGDAGGTDGGLLKTYLGTGNKMKLRNRFSNYLNSDYTADADYADLDEYSDLPKRIR
jgi:hypothetical protein